MSPDNASGDDGYRPRVGIPWRTSQEEAENRLPKMANYVEAVRKAGGEPVLLSLANSQKLNQMLASLDAFVLPGSPADVKPADYGAQDLGLSDPADQAREAADRAILQHSFAEKKPVLAICFGCQLLNVYLGGTLLQDLRAQTGTQVPHRKEDIVPAPASEPQHATALEPGSRVAAIAGRTQVETNSAHHQAIENPGKNLRITGRASDGTIESVEWTGDSNWVVGVQWHPERMLGDTFSERLFGEFVAAAQRARKKVAQEI
jgi:putative glutamine amidotransferase